MPGRAPRICLVTDEYPPKVGGVGVAARRLVGYLVEEGFEVHVVMPFRYDVEEHGVERVADGPVTVHRVLMSLQQGVFSAAIHFRELLEDLDREVGFDLFHGFFLTMAHLSVRTAGDSRPVLLSIRGSDAHVHLNHPFYRPYILAALRQATWVTSVNRCYLDLVSEQVGLTGRSSVIYNPCPSLPGPGWQPDENNRGVVGTVGTFRRVKDIPLLIRGYAHVAPEFRRRLLLLGPFTEKDEEEWSRTLLEELGVDAETSVTGLVNREDVPDRLRSLRVYAQSSAFEGLPNALMEAAALGVPLVATAVGGMAEILYDGASALLVPHGEPRRLGEALERVLRDEGLALSLSHGARDLASRFTPAREGAEWLALYRELLSGTGSASGGTDGG